MTMSVLSTSHLRIERRRRRRRQTTSVCQPHNSDDDDDERRKCVHSICLSSRRVFLASFAFMHRRSGRWIGGLCYIGFNDARSNDR